MAIREHRHDGPEAPFQKECPVCGIVFRTDIANTKYCSMECKRKRDYIAWKENHPESYEAHKEAMKRQQRERRA